MEHARDASLQDLVEKYVRTWDASSDSSLVDEVMAPDVIDHQPVGPSDGVQGVKRDIAIYHATFSDLALSCEDYVLGEDRVAVRWRASGTHDGDGLGQDHHGRCFIGEFGLLAAADGLIEADRPVQVLHGQVDENHPGHRFSLLGDSIRLAFWTTHS